MPTANDPPAAVVVLVVVEKEAFARFMALDVGRGEKPVNPPIAWTGVLRLAVPAPSGYKTGLPRPECSSAW